MTQKANDQQFCWERVLRSNSRFRLSHLFAPGQYSEALLALHALFASIDQLHSEVSEDAVARRKLDWWRFELLPENIERSRHPVVRHLNETGAAPSLSTAAIGFLLDAAERQIDAQPPANGKEFNKLCSVIYQPRIVLECALSAQDSALIPNQRTVAGEGGILQLLRASCAQAQHDYWWIPLNELARVGVTRQEIRDNCDAEPARAIFGQIMNIKHEPQAADSDHDQMQPSRTPGLLHLHLTALLQTRLMKQLRTIKPSVFSVELNRWRISDLLAAWRMARQSKTLTAQD